MGLIAHRIEVDPNRCHGKPVIAGTRVPVKTVLSALAAGESQDDIVREYGVTVEDIRAVIAFANEALAEWQYVPLKD